MVIGRTWYIDLIKAILESKYKNKKRREAVLLSSSL